MLEENINHETLTSSMLSWLYLHAGNKVKITCKYMTKNPQRDAFYSDANIFLFCLWLWDSCCLLCLTFFVLSIAFSMDILSSSRAARTFSYSPRCCEKYSTEQEENRDKGRNGKEFLGPLGFGHSNQNVKQHSSVSLRGK